MPNDKPYNVIDLQTGTTVARCSTRERALAKADKFDLAYGAIRYGVVEVASGRRCF